MSDAANEESLFVEQDDEIKSEDGSDQEGVNGSGDGGDGVDRDNRHTSVQDQPPNNNNERNNSENAQRQELELHHELGPNHEENPHHELNKDGNDDDECVEINANAISDAARARFAEFTFGTHPDETDDVIFTASVQIKAEEEEGDRFSSPQSSDDEAGSDFQLDEDEMSSDGEGRRKRRRAGPSRRNNRSTNSTRRQVAQRHKNTGAQHPKKQWEMPTDEELVELYTQQEELNALRTEGSLTIPQRVVLAKLTARIATIEKMASQQPPGLELPMEPLGEEHEDKEAAAVAAAPLVSPTHGTAATTEPKRGEAKNPKSKTPRRPGPKTAKEYWERQYAEKGSGLRNITENLGKRKRPAKKPNKGKNGKEDEKESRLMRMLQDSNPIVARAAQGSVAMPGPIQATRQRDQLKAMKDFLFKITGNANSGTKAEDSRRLDEAIKSFGNRQVQTVNGKWGLKGMRSTLYNHQLVGVSWMLRQEFSPDGPFGGILADQMGLGKTVQVLAAMSANRPSEEDIAAGRYQTLIVAPAVAIGQWEREIEKHCSFINMAHHFRAKQQLKPGMLKLADVM